MGKRNVFQELVVFHFRNVIGINEYFLLNRQNDDLPFIDS